LIEKVVDLLRTTV